jgi:hypothetical protein
VPKDLKHQRHVFSALSYDADLPPMGSAFVVAERA